MSNKIRKSDLYRQIADQLDQISSLEEQLAAERQIRETTNSQLMLANNQLELVKSQQRNSQQTIEELREIGQDFHKQANDNSEVLTEVKRVFGVYELQDFIDLEAMAWQAKGEISSEDFDTISEFEEEEQYVDNLINLAEELKIVKGEFFDDKGEEDERLKEF